MIANGTHKDLNIAKRNEKLPKVMKDGQLIDFIVLKVKKSSSTCTKC